MTSNTDAPPARFIVFETSGIWAAALREHVKPLGIRVIQTRNRPDFREELEASPASFLGLELVASNRERIVEELQFVGGNYPNSRAVVFSTSNQDAFRWLLYEAGAAHVVQSRRRLAAVAGMARRHLDAAPDSDLTFAERIMAGLPW